MNKGVLQIKYKGYEDFLVKRKQLDGFGGSDISTILGLNPYKSTLELFHEKIGLHNPVKMDNIAMYSGRVLEEILIKEFWEYHNPENPSEEEFLKNANAKNKIRKARKYNSILSNPAFPHLFYSPDSMFNQDTAILEAKTALGFVVNQWEAGIPPAYIMQIHQGFLITGIKYGEIALLKDGRNMDVFPIECNDSICETILNSSTNFWLKIREAKQMLNSNASLEEKNAFIAEIEPAPDGSMAYADYLKKRYSPEHNVGVIEGIKEQLEAAIDYKRHQELKNIAEEHITTKSNELKKFLADNNAHTITFGKQGRVTWLANKHGVPSFRVSLK